MATVTRAVGFEGHGYDLFKVTLAFTAIAIVFVFARLLARYKVKAIGIDDCLIVVSVVSIHPPLTGRTTSSTPHTLPCLRPGLTLLSQCFSVVLGVATCVGKTFIFLYFESQLILAQASITAMEVLGVP